MDLKTFGEDDFDPKRVINKAWSSSGDQDKEIFLTNAVTRLQLYMKQLTNSLDETTTQIVTSVPRILQDAAALQVEGSLLQQKLTSLELMVQDVEEQTGNSIESLQRIDYLKSKLENAAAALREADKWAALAAGLEDMLEAGLPTSSEQLNQLNQHVAAMTASLEVLSESSEYETKRLQLETLYNKLEAAITPPLIEALTKMDATTTAVYVDLFSSMSRSVSAKRCWRRSAAARLASAWRRLDSPRASQLTALLADEAERQMEWLLKVLKSDTPLAELLRLYTDLLLSVEPSPTKVVKAYLKLCSNPDEGILMMTDLRSDIDDFIKSIRSVIEAPRQSKETLIPAISREFGRAAYAPLRELLPKYTELQTQLLLDHLKDPQLKQEDMVEHARALLSIAERCESWIDNAFNRATKIASGAAYPYYLPAADTFLTAISNLISAHGRLVESFFLRSSSAGVLSAAFPATLTLEAATNAVLQAAGRHMNELQAETQDKDPLSDVTAFLLETDTHQRLPALMSEPWSCVASIKRSKEHLKSLSKSILRKPVDVQLDKIPHLTVWSNNDAMSTDLPDFALSPQEYITEIGQYLMTLPQHLEMHISEKQAPWQFLSEVCVHTCDLYAEKILNIRNMDALGTKRCLTDIVYLSSVVEDLGSSVTPSLKNLEKSLRAAAPAHND